MSNDYTQPHAHKHVPTKTEASCGVSESVLNDLLCGFEEWLRSVCFQKPTPEAYDLAKSAWIEAAKRNNTEYAEKQFIEASKDMGW